MKEELFDKVTQIYLPKFIQVISKEEFDYKGCIIWILNIKEKRIKSNSNYKRQFDIGKTNKQLLEEGKAEYYYSEGFLPISDYLIKYDCEFEEHITKELGVWYYPEEALGAMERYIDKHYMEVLEIII
jgi:hypothetical protein